MKIDDLSQKQLDILNEVGVDVEDLTLIEGKELHDYMISADAYTDGERLVFVDVSDHEQQKFIYYMGAENEAVLTTRYEGVSVYEEISEERLSRYDSKEEDADG